MNFLLRSTQNVHAEQPSPSKTYADSHYTSQHAVTLEGLMSEDLQPQYSVVENCDGETDIAGDDNKSTVDRNDKSDSKFLEKHSDVSAEEGWITIPYEKLPDDWNEAPDIHSLHSLDRSFVFPGEQIHIMACLSACKQDTEVITPFKVAAMMSKNGKRKSLSKENENVEDGSNLVSGPESVNPDQAVDQNGENMSSGNIYPQKEAFAGESLLRMEDHRRQTELLLQRFENSHFFVRIAESGEPLWSRKGSFDKSPESSEMDGQKTNGSGLQKSSKHSSYINAIIDRGNFDANVSGGVARNTVKCCSLPNGDIVVLLKVNIDVEFFRDPVIEVLQFEKYQERRLSNLDSMVYPNPDTCDELLKWLHPLDNTIASPARPLSPPHLSPGVGVGSASPKPNFSSSSGSQLFSFGNFRSYSMSSLPQNTTPLPSPVKTTSSKSNFDLEDWDISQKFSKSQKTGTEELLSFRGVSLERERFSVRCGLEGIYIPGRRWRRKLEIIQPVEIKSFAADCNTEDLLCVQIKNVSPVHLPDIMVYIDAISIVIEEASNSGPPSSLPIACIEAGDEHNLPNLSLRRGEEHSFILKPATFMWRNFNGSAERSFHSSQLPLENAASGFRLSSKIFEGKRSASNTQHCAIMVSCRCNYTESRLFFKHPTDWRPRISRDLMISVASEMSVNPSGPNGNIQLPVQVLTLQASNLTAEDLTLTVLAPASLSSLPSVISLSSSPSSPMSPFVGFADFTGQIGGERQNMLMQRLSSAPVVSETQKHNSDVGARSVSFNEQTSPAPDVIPSTGFSCTHLWLQSRVPLGCVPAQSMATIKLELLPLTDGIITLDTLQIDVKEKGITYIPECSLKINATSSISSGIL